MVVTHKDWQALPVTTTTISIPNIKTHPQPLPQPTYTPLPDNIQQPTTHISSKPDIVELHRIKHNKPIEPRAMDIQQPPDVVRPKKKS